VTNQWCSSTGKESFLYSLCKYVSGSQGGQVGYSPDFNLKWPGFDTRPGLPTPKENQSNQQVCLNNHLCIARPTLKIDNKKVVGCWSIHIALNDMKNKIDHFIRFSLSIYS